jgi:hypothetical protein
MARLQAVLQQIRDHVMAKQNLDEYFADGLGGAPAPEPAPSALVIDPEPGDLPAKFARNSHLAVDAAAMILELKPDPASTNYGVELRAVTAAAIAQISAQIKIDEAAIVQRRRDDTMAEILALIEREEARLAELPELERQALDLPPLPRVIEGECTKD